MKDSKRSGFATRALHVGSDPDPTTGAVVTPIYMTSTYAQKSPGVHQGFDYGRSHNLTRYALEACVASLESGERGFAFSSGLAAISAILDTLPAGSHVIAGDDLYGGTYRLFERVKKPASQLSVTYAKLESTPDLEKLLTPHTRLVWVESPSNPLLKISDLRALASMAQKRGILCVADNTFASPYLQNPLDLGFDLVVHSTTKYLNGHSDVIGGVVISGNTPRGREYADKVAFVQNAVGAVPSPFDCFLTHRGLKTLALRVDKQCDNAEALAQWLASQPRVSRVIYPGLASHPQHAVARSQMKRFGGMISFVLNAPLEGVRRFLEGLEVFTLAESLGAVESLIEHPAIMTHASIPADIRKGLGIDDGLIRISAGVEDLGDLTRDLEAAFGRLGP